MLGLQEWIHKFEVGEGVRYVKLAVTLLGLFGLTIIYDIRQFKNFSSQEAMDSAQLARNIAQGRGYTTQFIRPLSILLLQRQAPPGIPVLKSEHPDLANPPVYPLLLAGWMKALPFHFEIEGKSPFWSHQPEVLIAILNQLLFFGAIFLTFQLARRLFDEPVAWVAAVVFAGADLLWRFSVSGLSTMLLILLFLGILWCLMIMEQNQREQTRTQTWFVTMAALVGLLTGIGGLTRYSFAWLILPIVAFLVFFFGNRRLLVAGAALAACILVITPWLIRNYYISGAPFGTAGYALYQETEPFPGNRLERFLNNEFDSELAKVGPTMVVRKFMVNTARIVQEDLPRLGGSLAAGFFLVSLLIPFRNIALGRLRVLLLMCLVLLIIVQALGRTHLSTDSPELNSENLLVLLAPAVFMFGVGLFLLVLDQIELPFPPLRTAAMAAFALVMCAPLVFRMLPPRSYPHVFPPYWPPRIQEFSNWIGPGELMMSDMPWAVAWYGDRKCVWITLDAPSDTVRNGATDFYAVYDFQKPISALYLTSLTTDAQFSSQMMRSPDWAWGKFVIESQIRKAVPNGFPLKYSVQRYFDDGQVLLADRPRWTAKSK